MIRKTLELDLQGPLLIGGYSDPGGRADATTARDQDGPIVPATALRGAWREAYARLLTTEGALPTPCTPAEPCRGTYCQVCEAFGHGDAGNPLLLDAPGVADPEGWNIALRLGSARPDHHATPPLEVRPSVSVDRYTRTQVPGRLFTREHAVMGECTTLRASVVFRDDHVMADLERALPLWTSIGSGASKGQGVVLDARLVEAKRMEDRPLRGSNGIKAGAVLRVLVQNDEPIVLGGTPVDGNLRETTRFIPGSALAGAVVWAARRAGLDHDGASKLAAGLSFSDLHPTDNNDDLSSPMPRCFMRCTGDEPHIVDRSVIEAAQRALSEVGRGVPKPAVCTRCGSELKAATGILGSKSGLRTRTVTRLARDTHRGTAAPGMLHVIQQIEAGHNFNGTVQVEPTANVEALGAALKLLESEGVLPILLGGRRSKGMGAVHLSIASRKDDLQRRITAWRQLHNRTASALSQALGWNLAHMVLLVARTPVSTPYTAGNRICAALGAPPAAMRAVWVRAQTRAGWDSLAGQPTSAISVAAPGSAWLLELSAPPDIKLLTPLESQGIETDPAFRRLGLGLLTTCPAANN